MKKEQKVMEVFQVIFAALWVMWFCACNNTDKIKPVPAFSFKTYPAYWVEKDSTRRIGFLSIQVTPKVRTDSSKNTSSLQADTLVGYTQTTPILDSLKRQVYDSFGKPKQIIRQFLVRNTPDTIIWLDNKDVDSLLKIKGKLKLN